MLMQFVVGPLVAVQVDRRRARRSGLGGHLQLLRSRLGPAVGPGLIGKSAGGGEKKEKASNVSQGNILADEIETSRLASTVIESSGSVGVGCAI